MVNYLANSINKNIKLMNINLNLTKQDSVKKYLNEIFIICKGIICDYDIKLTKARKLNDNTLKLK